MRGAFISAPIGGVPADEQARVKQLEHSGRALALATMLAGNGYKPYVPHVHVIDTEAFTVPPERWLRICLEWLWCCDAIFMLSGWQDSPGCCCELRAAIDWHKDVFIEGASGSWLEAKGDPLERRWNEAPAADLYDYKLLRVVEGELRAEHAKAFLLQR